MPTSDTPKPDFPILFMMFLAALLIAALIVEVFDPAPVDVDAAGITAP